MISLTSETNFHPRLTAGGLIGLEDESKAVTNARAVFVSLISKFAVMLDVAIPVPRFPFQGIVTLMRKRLYYIKKTAALVDFQPHYFPFGGRTNLTLKRLPWAAWRLRRRGSWRQVKPNYRF